MKSTTTMAAAVLAGLMALSMTACGAAPSSTALPNEHGRYSAAQHGSPTDGTGKYRYTGPADNKSNVRRNMGEMLDQAGNATENIGRGLEDTARDAANSAKRAYDNAVYGSTGNNRSDTGPNGGN